MPVFESPDKGETVYVRQSDSIDRYLVKENISIRDQIRESQLWGNIHCAAKTNPALQEALDRVKVTYYLTKHYEERYGNRKT
jgi:hypothetical protein